MKLKQRIILMLSMSALFATMAILVKTDLITQLDITIEQMVASTVNQSNTFICKMLSVLGKWYGYAGISCLLFLLPKTRFWLGLPAGFTLGCAIVANKVLKALFAVERPEGFGLTQAHGYSFPSGHAMYGIAFIGIITYILLTKIRSGRGKFGGISLAALFLLAVGFSRVYLGVHHPSDVLGGYLAGTVVLVVCIVVCEMFAYNLKQIR